MNRKHLVTGQPFQFMNGRHLVRRRGTLTAIDKGPRAEADLLVMGTENAFGSAIDKGPRAEVDLLVMGTENTFEAAIVLDEASFCYEREKREEKSEARSNAKDPSKLHSRYQCHHSFSDIERQGYLYRLFANRITDHSRAHRGSKAKSRGREEEKGDDG